MPHLHMELRRRKALALRLAAATDIEGRPLPSADENAVGQLKAFLDTIFAAANALENDAEPTLAKALQHVGERLAGHKFFGEGAAIHELFRRRDNLVDRLRGDICQRCVENTKLSICTGNRSLDDEVVAQRGHCISALRELTMMVEEEVCALYQRQAREWPAVRLRFATDRVHSQAVRGLFAEFNISGWTDLRDGTVGIEIKDRALNRDSLSQVVYVLAHELVCHAFQGLEAPSQRQNADETCSWSEGWMDRLAFTLIHQWLDTRTKSLPGWLRSDPGAAQNACNRLHSRRYISPVDPLDEYQVTRRVYASWAFDHLRRVWATSPAGDATADHRVVRFSLRLNLLGSMHWWREATLSAWRLARSDWQRRLRVQTQSAHQTAQGFVWRSRMEWARRGCSTPGWRTVPCR